MIRLLDKTSNLHENALGYFRYFLENDFLIRMSTIAVAEFCVKDQIEHLPLQQILLSPFNAIHASRTGECARILYSAKAKGVLEVNARVLIQNDVKLLVQAECESAEYYLTSDSRSKRMYDVLKENNKLSFDFTDIHIPFSAKFGILDF
ncbi:MAG: hypothetical protein IJ762_07030 [Bacteroidaceae bacterium]|nr:hypothetical protein [Bacteroidaceae bacterium]